MPVCDDGVSSRTSRCFDESARVQRDDGCSGAFDGPRRRCDDDSSCDNRRHDHRRPSCDHDSRPSFRIHDHRSPRWFQYDCDDYDNDGCSDHNNDHHIRSDTATRTNSRTSSPSHPEVVLHGDCRCPW